MLVKNLCTGALSDRHIESKCKNTTFLVEKRLCSTALEKKIIKKLSPLKSEKESFLKMWAEKKVLMSKLMKNMLTNGNVHNGEGIGKKYIFHFFEEA